jgi:hypothetical protein
VVTFHNLMVRSKLALARIPPPGWKATDVASTECPSNARRCSPLGIAHSLIVPPTSPPVASMPPLPSKAVTAGEPVEQLSAIEVPQACATVAPGSEDASIRIRSRGEHRLALAADGAQACAGISVPDADGAIQ